MGSADTPPRPSKDALPSWRVRFTSLPDGWFELPIQAGSQTWLRAADPYRKLVAAMTKQRWVEKRSARRTELYVRQIAPNGFWQIGGVVRVLTRKKPPTVDTRSIHAFQPGKVTTTDLMELVRDHPFDGQPIEDPVLVDLPSGPAVRGRLPGERDTVRLLYWILIRPAVPAPEHEDTSYLLGLIGAYTSPNGSVSPEAVAELDLIAGSAELAWVEAAGS